MRERFAQLAHLALHIDVLVHAARVVPKHRAKETNRTVARPPAMLYFAPEKKIAARYPVSLAGTRTRNDASNLFTKCRRPSLVRIDDEDPVGTSALDRRIALRTNRREWMRHHRRTGTPRELHRRIRRFVFHDDHFTSPGDTRHAGFDVRGFVPRRDDDRYRD